MRFRAVVRDPQLFADCVQLLEKSGRHLIIHLNPEEIHFIVYATAIATIHSWITVRPEKIFHGMVLESKDEDNIYIIVELSSLLPAIRSAGDSEIFRVRLTVSGNMEVLAFTTVVDPSESITQFVPIRRRARDELMDEVWPLRYESPEVAVSIPFAVDGDEYIVPPSLRATVKRIKNVANSRITLVGNMAGELKVQSADHRVFVRTNYRNMEHPSEDPNIQNGSTLNLATVSVEAKGLLAALEAYRVSPSRIIACLYDKRYLRIVATHDALGEITFVLPHQRPI